MVFTSRAFDREGDLIGDKKGSGRGIKGMGS